MTNKKHLINEYFLNGKVAQYVVEEQAHPIPSIAYVKNAFVSAPSIVGATNGWRQPSGAVYDANGNLIEQSRMRVLQELKEEVSIPEDAEVMKGKYIYLGYYNEVYGHFILETLARLWAFDVSVLDNREFIFHSMHGNTTINKSYTREVLASFGIDDSKVHILKTETIVEDILVPSSLSFIGESQHEEIKQTFNKVHSEVKDNNENVSIYISRAKVKNGNHRFINEEAVEAIFEQFGFQIVRPEEMSLPDQLLLYRSADVVAGPLSSALHNSIFSKNGTTVIALNGRWNRPRPSEDIIGKSIKKRSVQDFICMNYDQPIHYIEAQKAFAIDDHAPGRMPYWISEAYLADMLSHILEKPVPESLKLSADNTSLEVMLLDSLIEYAGSKKMDVLKSKAETLTAIMNTDDPQANTGCEQADIETSLVDVLPNSQILYDKNVAQTRQRLNALLNTAVKKVA